MFDPHKYTRLLRMLRSHLRMGYVASTDAHNQFELFSVRNDIL